MILMQNIFCTNLPNIHNSNPYLHFQTLYQILPSLIQICYKASVWMRRTVQT